MCNPEIHIAIEQSVVESSAPLKSERFSNFQKTSAEKKFETCGPRNLGKLIIVACWSPLKGRQLGSQRPRRCHRGQDKLPKSHCFSTNSPQPQPFVLLLVLFCEPYLKCFVHILNSERYFFTYPSSFVCLSFSP